MNVYRKLWRILEPKQRRSAFILLIFMAIGMLLEMLSVGLVIPAIGMMTQDDLTVRYPVLSPLSGVFNKTNPETLVVWAMLSLVGIYAFKSLFLAFLAWKQSCFTYSLQQNLSQRLFTGYLRQPYVFHIQRNSAQLIRNIIGQVTSLTNVSYQGLMLMTEMLVLLGVSALLILVEPIGAVVVMAVLVVAGWGFYQFTRNFTLRWGEALQHHEGLRIQHLQQGIGGSKEVKLLGRESDFEDQYQLHNAGSAFAARNQTVIQALPRLLLEMLAVAGLAVLVIIMIGKGNSLGMLLPTLGLFAAAAFRLMPSANRVIGAVQSMRFSLPAIETIHDELQILESAPPNEDGRNTTGQQMLYSFTLTLKDVFFTYPLSGKPSLCGVSLEIPVGSSVGFIGGSGAGKSTLIDVILGLLTPDSGVVTVDGVDIQSNLRGWQDQIGYVPQTIFLTDDTLLRNIAFGLPVQQIDEGKVMRAVRAAQLDFFVNELPLGLNTVVGEHGVRLSGGQRQRIGIARALYHDPPVLVLDEATSSLDTATESGVMDAVRALKGDKTVIIVAHRLSTIDHCDRLFRLEKGVLIAEGDMQTVLDKGKE